jgi:hypothetical protein
VEEIQNIPNYSVYCILNPDAAGIELFLADTYGINEPFPLASGKYIKNARVSIADGSHSKTLLLNEKTKKYEAENLGFVKGNSTYFLRIIIGQDTLNARTFVPSQTELVIEEAEVYENEAIVRVAWEKDKQNNTSYRLSGSVDAGTASNPFFYWGSEFGIWRTAGEYSSDNFIRSPVGNFSFAKALGKVNVQIILESLDNNFYQFRNKLDALLIRDSFTKKFESPIFYTSNVSKAVGIFGAYTKTEIVLEMKNP